MQYIGVYLLISEGSDDRIHRQIIPRAQFEFEAVGNRERALPRAHTRLYAERQSAVVFARRTVFIYADEQSRIPYRNGARLSRCSFARPAFP